MEIDSKKGRIAEELPLAMEAAQGFDNKRDIRQIELEEQNEELLRIQMVLETQQVELELQNEELVRIQGELELSRNKYSELYDVAPVAFFTFDARGLIQEANLAGAHLLGIKPGLLAGKPFTTFIDDEEGRVVYTHHIETVLNSGGMQRCEIKLTGKDDTVIYGQLQSVFVENTQKEEVHILSSIVDVTVTTQLRVEIQEAREYAESIVENVHKPLVVLSSDLKILSANHSFYETFTVTPEETIGNFIYDLGNRQWDIPGLRALFEDILPHESMFNGYEVEHTFPGIGHKIILLNAREIFREKSGMHIILLAMEDITERKQLEKVLQDSEEQLEVTLNSIGDAVIATDADARLTRINPIAEQLTGWTQAEAAGRRIDEVFHIVNKDTRLPAPIPVQEAIALGTIQGLANHTVLIARDGSEYDIADSCAPIRDRDNRVVGAVLVFRDVTEEYAVQQSLRDSAALMRGILNTVVDGIITIHARGGVVETVNPAAELMFGYTAAELDGQNFSLLIPELDQDQRTGSLEYYSAGNEASANGNGREVMGRRKDGSLFPLELAVSEMSLGGQRYFTGILRDTTARKQAEEALLKEGALQSAIFNSANFSSIATDAKGVIQIFNVGAERMLGYTADDVRDKITPADISDPLEVIARAEALSAELGTPITPGFEALVFKASRGIEDIYELTYIRKDGSRFPAVVSVTALRDEQNAIIGYLLIGTDNTARKQVEAERVLLEQVLQDKNVELERATLVAERANLAKSDFLSSMSHELRTPLSAILGFAQLIESGSPEPTPTQMRSIDQILKAGWYLLELINEILDLAVIESGKLSMSLEPISLSEIMHECESLVETQANKRDIKVTFVHFETPCIVKADRTRVKQVLINLLSNAIKYNRAGGTVIVDSVLTNTDSIRISVRDTGEGLAPEQLAKLFQPFNRLGQEASAEQGTGIGLVVCKRLVEWMGGVIGVESTVGKGSVFWIELNLTTELHIETHAAKASALPEANDHDSALYTVLYVEDNPANLMLVEDIIARRPDIRLLSALDGKNGIELARASLPDVILMDIHLPGISGIDAMKILIADHATAHIPVIALSANAIPRDIEKGLEAGFFRYLTKPIKVNEFMDTLNVALNYAKKKAASGTKFSNQVDP